MAELGLGLSARWTQEPGFQQPAAIAFSCGVYVEPCDFLPYTHANLISSRMIPLSFRGSRSLRPCLNTPYFVLLFQMESDYQNLYLLKPNKA